MASLISLKAVKITLPFKEKVCDNWGKYECSNHGIVIAESDEGAAGIGEISFAWFGGAHSMCDEINEYWSKHIIGCDITDINSVCVTLDKLCAFSKRHLTARAGVETALWDLLGKSLKVPVYALFGGKFRDSVKLTGGIAMGSPEEMAEEAKKRIAEGYTELKLKINSDIEKSIAGIKAVRKIAGDNIKLRADCNMSWTDRKTALVFADMLYEMGVRIIEQPFDCARIKDAAWLTERTKCRILCDEGVWTREDAKNILQKNAADMLHIYICEAGGIKESLAIADLAESFGKSCTIGSMPEGKTGAAAALQTAAAMKNLSVYPSDIRGFTVYENDVVRENFEIRNGEIKIPSAPGTGVTLDYDKLRFYRKD